MDSTVRATCPTCRSPLRIPAEWVGQAVRCKKCGAVVKSKPRTDTSAPVQTPGPVVFELDDAPHPPPAAANGDGFDDLVMPGRGAAPGPDDLFRDHPDQQPQPLPLPPDHGTEPFGQLGTRPAEAYNPFTASQPEAAPQAPPPGYPYPVPPGYPHPYPAAGYPYPVPPGYPPHPGYPYPVPPGYPPPYGYAPPPGYPYPAPPGAPAPHATMPPAPAPYPAAAPVYAPQPAPAPVHHHAPDFVPPSGEFQPSSTTAAYKRRKHGSGGPVVLVVVGVLAVGLVVGGISLSKALKNKGGGTAGTTHTDDHKGGKDTTGHKEHPPGKEPTKGGGDTKKGGDTATKSPAPSGPGFPRRLLFVQISNYAFLNPVTGAPANADKSKTMAQRMAFEWRMPTDRDNNQVYVLSDTLLPSERHLPIKPVLKQTYERFFETSRGQDRIVVYFGGHAFEKDGKAYLVPVEGDTEDEATLLSVEEFYARLGECKATQKVVIWDVCRRNPQRGNPIRPGSEPMSEGLAKALAAARPACRS